MRGNLDRGKQEHRQSALADNVLRETADDTLLVCGHYAHGQPVAIYPNRRKLYACPKGCGLQKAKR